VAQPGTAGITVFNSTPGGGTSNLVAVDVAGPGENPVPLLTSLNPATAAANDPTAPGKKVTLHGSNFTPDSEVLWNGSARYTTYLSETELQISLKAGDVAQPNAAGIQVRNPIPGGGTSNSTTFLVTAPGDNPLPSVTGFSFKADSGPGIILVIHGNGFTNSTKGLWNGAIRTTTFMSNQAVSIQLTLAEFSAATATIQVENPSPGGGISNLFLYKPVKTYLPGVFK
jgi:hypothetical protein